MSAAKQPFGLPRIELLHQRAVAADVGDERAGELRVFAVDEALDELRELAVLRDEPLHAMAEAAVLWIEVFLKRGGELAVNGFVVLLERLLHAANFALDQVGRRLAADVPQGQDADLERFESVTIALVAFADTRAGPRSRPDRDDAARAALAAR